MPFGLRYSTIARRSSLLHCAPILTATATRSGSLVFQASWAARTLASALSKWRFDDRRPGSQNGEDRRGIPEGTEGRDLPVAVHGDYGDSFKGNAAPVLASRLRGSRNRCHISGGQHTCFR